MIKKSLLDLYKLELSSNRKTNTDYHQFEKNVRSEFICNHLQAMIKTIKSQEELIDKVVYRYKNNILCISFNDYTSKVLENPTHAVLNKLEDESFTYTKDNFTEFELKYIKINIDSLKIQLVHGNLYMNSTNPLANIVHQFKIESKQKLIDFLTQLI